MSKKLSTFVILALFFVLAFSCQAQKTTNRTATIGAYTTTEGPACTAFYGPGAFSPQGLFGFYNCQNQLWRWNVTTGEEKVVIDPQTQPYGSATATQITDTGLAFFFATGPQGQGQYTIDLTGKISPVFAGSFLVQNQQVTYPIPVRVARDGKTATGDAIWNNATATTFSIDLSSGAITPLYSAVIPTGMEFNPTSSESNVLYGLYRIDTGSTLGGNLANMDPSTGSVTPLAAAAETVNGIQYTLFRDGLGFPGYRQAASWRHGPLLVVPQVVTPYAGTGTPADLLVYSVDSKQFVCQVKNQDLSPTGPNEATSVSSSYSGGEMVFDGSNAQDAINSFNSTTGTSSIPFTSAVYYIPMNVDGCPAPQMIAGPGVPLFPGDTNTAAAAPAITENGTIFLQYTYQEGNNPLSSEYVKMVPLTPRINPLGVVDSAAYSNIVAPGQLTSAFGIRLATGTCQAVSVPLPSTLCGAQVLVNGVPAPLNYVSPGQINFQFPYEPAVSSTVTIQSSLNGFLSSPQSMTVAATNVAVFSNSLGPAATHADGTQITPTSQATPGETVVIYGDGAGATNPPAVTGAAATGQTCGQKFAAFVGQTPATLDYCGLTPTLVGLNQFNVTLPNNGAPVNASDITIVLQNSTSSAKFTLPYAGK